MKHFSYLCVKYSDFFPYEQYRNDQESIISQIYESAKVGKNTILIASNGTGKTIIALTALLPIALEKEYKIIYCCRTFTQNARVIEESKAILQKLKRRQSEVPKGSTVPMTSFSAISIRGRSEMCIHKTLQKLSLSPTEAMSACADLRKNKKCLYFMNLVKLRSELEKIADDLLENPMDSAELIQYASNKKLCPYFLTKILIVKADVIACNYQWILNPNIRENFLEGISELGKLILVFDECHNLPQVASDINSERITLFSIDLAMKDLETYKGRPESVNIVRASKRVFEKFTENVVDDEVKLDSKKFISEFFRESGIPNFEEFKKRLEYLNNEAKAIVTMKEEEGKLGRDYISGIVNFWLKFITTIDNPEYFHCIQSSPGKRGPTHTILVNSLSPRKITDPIFSQSATTLCMSGTINAYTFHNILGFNRLGKMLKILTMKYPFPKENVLVLFQRGVDTKGENRNAAMYEKIVQRLEEVIENTPKNVGIFCASYVVLNGLLDAGLRRVAQRCNKALFIEEAGSSASENDIMIEQYKEKSKENGAVLLGVAGGRNSEGEDFPGDYMNTVCIVGIPFQKPVPSLEAMINYYESLFPKNGRMFAYIVPAFEKSNQACGRPIRRMDDKGAVILMDDRFINYGDLLSLWVQENFREVQDTRGAIGNLLKQFFKNYSKSDNISR